MILENDEYFIMHTRAFSSTPLCFTDFNLGEYFTYYLLKYCKKKKNI